MSRDADDEFDAAARDVGQQLTNVGVPRVEATVEKWLRRLTAAGRGANELNHLRLLRLMVANRRVGRPFLRDPPAAGRLLPLNVYLRPRARTGVRPPVAVGCDRRPRHLADESESSFEWTAVDEAARPDSRQAATERGGHLQAGDGGGCVCRDARGQLCDPCLDRLGLRLKPGSPKPADVAYRDLLGDCALPGLTAADLRSLDPGLLRVIQTVDDATTLQDFYFQVSLHACDRGTLLIRCSDDLVDNFREFVRDVVECRTQHIGQRLVDEQMSARDRYAQLRDRALNRATVALDFVREVIPTFNWYAYQADPDAYLRRQILRRAHGDDGDEDDDRGGDGDGVADGYDGDGDGDVGGGTDRTKALFELNDLQAEETRLDLENCRLHEERARMNERLAELDARLSAARARAADDIARCQDAMTLLRKDSADQMAEIDRLTASIQVTVLDEETAATRFC